MSKLDEFKLLKIVLLQSTQPNGWSAILEHVDTLLDCRSFLIMFNDLAEPVVRFGGRLCEEDLADFLRKIESDDGGNALQFLLSEAPLYYTYCKPVVAKNATGQTELPAQEHACSALPDAADTSSHPTTRLMPDQIDSAYGLMSPIWRREGSAILFGLVFADREPASLNFAQERENFKKIVQALAPGLKTYFQLEKERAQNEIHRAFLSTLTGSALLINRKREILARTSGGHEALVAADLAAGQEDKLIVKNKSVEAVLQKLLAMETEAQNDQHRRVRSSEMEQETIVRSIFVVDPLGELKRVSFRTVPMRALNGVPAEPWLVIKVASPTDIPEELEQVLQEHYDLSQSEAHLARCLTMTGSMKATVDQLSITRNTAKTHLRRIYEKTGSHTQLQLAGLVHRLAGMF